VDSAEACASSGPRVRDTALSDAVAATDARRDSWPATADRAAADERLGEAVSAAKASALSLSVIAESLGTGH
jgi:hypothetical protein